MLMRKQPPQKGQQGYRNYHKKMELLKILAGFCLILVLLGIRMAVNETSWKNILTVSAILTVLPTANLASPFLAALPYSGPKKEFYQMLAPYEGQMTVLYDLILTSKEFIMPMDGILVHPTGVYAYCTNPKIRISKAEAFYNELFCSHRLDLPVKIITDEKSFFKRAGSLKPADGYEDDGSVDYAAKLLKNLSM